MMNDLILDLSNIENFFDYLWMIEWLANAELTELLLLSPYILALLLVSCGPAESLTADVADWYAAVESSHNICC